MCCEDVANTYYNNECCGNFISVASTNTFKSDGADMHSVLDGTEDQTKAGQQQFGSILANGSATDRTSAWLNYHHDVNIDMTSNTPQRTPSKKEVHQKNAIYGLFW